MVTPDERAALHKAANDLPAAAAALLLPGIVARLLGALDALDAVRDLHAPRQYATSGSSDPRHEPSMATVCLHCGGVGYPCATIRAIDGGASS